MATNDTNDESAFTKSLQQEVERLKKDKESLINEFKQSQDEETSLEVAKRAFAEASANAIVKIILLSESAESEGIQFTASKYIIECGLGDKLFKGDTRDDKELRKLFEGIKAKAKQPRDKALVTGTETPSASAIIADALRQNPSSSINQANDHTKPNEEATKDGV